MLGGTLMGPPFEKTERGESGRGSLLLAAIVRTGPREVHFYPLFVAHSNSTLIAIFNFWSVQNKIMPIAFPISTFDRVVLLLFLLLSPW